MTAYSNRSPGRGRLHGAGASCAASLLACAALASTCQAADAPAKPAGVAPAAQAGPPVDAADIFRTRFAPGVDRIPIYRVYNGPDGNSKLEKVWLRGKRQPFFDKDKGLFRAEGVQVNKESVAFLQGRLAHVNIYNAPADVDLPAHTSPGSEMFLVLRGGSELVLRDGTRQKFGPGDIVLFEDTTGPGRGGRTGPEGFTAVNFSFVVQAPAGSEVER